MAFDAAPGEMLVIQNVANLLRLYIPDGGQHATSAALEFSVRVLKVYALVVMGHAMPGGVRALLGDVPLEGRVLSLPRSAWRALRTARCCAAPTPRGRKGGASKR